MISFVSAFQLYNFEEKFTQNQRNKLVTIVQKVLEEKIPEDLEVSITQMKITPDSRIEITLKGKRPDDESFTANILKDIVGETISFNHLKPHQELWGTLRGVGNIGFGVFIDAGIQNPEKQILIPLFTLRKQLVKDEKLPSREILTKYGFMDYMPVQIEIVRVDTTRPDQPQIEAQFSTSFLNKIKSWVDAGNDIVFAAGTARRWVKREVAKSRHSQDVVEFQRLGALETALICKSGTYAPGLMSAIGPHLLKTRLSMLIPAQIRRFWK